VSQEFLDALDADLGSVFFGESDFTEPATYVPASGVPYSLHVLFDDPYADPDAQGGGSKVQTRAVTVTVRESAILTGAKPGDAITVRGITWKVISAEPNGVGVLTLAVHK
jgi:hypothetical protein